MLTYRCTQSVFKLQVNLNMMKKCKSFNIKDCPRPKSEQDILDTQLCKDSFENCVRFSKGLLELRNFWEY